MYDAGELVCILVPNIIWIDYYNGTKDYTYGYLYYSLSKLLPYSFETYGYTRMGQAGFRSAVATMKLHCSTGSSYTTAFNGDTFTHILFQCTSADAAAKLGVYLETCSEFYNNHDIYTVTFNSNSTIKTYTVSGTYGYSYNIPTNSQKEIVVYNKENSVSKAPIFSYELERVSDFTYHSTKTYYISSLSAYKNYYSVGFGTSGINGDSMHRSMGLIDSIIRYQGDSSTADVLGYTTNFTLF